MATPTRTSFRLTGADGGPLRGDVRAAAARGPAPAVVICHGFQGFKDWGFIPPAAERLARAGLTVVTFSFSGSGVGDDGETLDEPDRFAHATYSNHARDLDVVLAALAAGRWGAPPGAVGLLGHSMGGSLCVLRAARDPAVRALVTWGAPPRFGSLWDPARVPEWRATGRLAVQNRRGGDPLYLATDVLDDLEAHRDGPLDVLAAARAVRAPWLIVHGERDESVPVAAARQLHRAAPRGELLLVPGGSHTFSVGHPWRGPTRALEVALGATVEWFMRHLT